MTSKSPSNSPAPESSRESEARQTARDPKAVIAVAAFAAFLATFNETYLNVAFAPIMTALSIDVTTVQWLATAYMLGAAVMVPVSAFAFRSVPTRPLFCATTRLLVLGSVIGALAPTFPVLLIGRIVQALGTGMLIPIGMNITLTCAPREKLGTYMGIMGAMTTLGPSVSVIAAGLLLAIAPWNVLLWVFAGLSALCLLCGAVFLGDIAHLTHPRLDAASVALAGIALVGILYAVSTVFSGSVPIALCTAVVGVIALVLFVRRQGRLAEPLIDLRPLRVAPFTLGVIINMISLLTIFAMNIIVPVFMQTALGASSLVASLTLFPAILASCVVSPLAGRAYDRHGVRLLLPAGFALIAVFSALLAFFIATGSVVVLALLYIPVIAGSALIIGPVQSFALSKLPPEQNPHGVTVMSTGFQIAGCIGSSVFTSIYGAVLGASLAGGALQLDAAATGFLVTGLSVAGCAAVGFALSLVEGRYPAALPAFEMEPSAEAASRPDAVLASIMKTDVYSLTPTQTVHEALQLFADKGVSGVPVVDASGRPVGFVSDGDVMAYLADQVPAFKSTWSFVAESANRDFDATVRKLMAQPVSAIARPHVISVNLNDPMGEVCRVLAEHHLKKAPVMDGDRMVGIVNRSNVTKWTIKDYLEK